MEIHVKLAKELDPLNADFVKICPLFCAYISCPLKEECWKKVDFKKIEEVLLSSKILKE